jgi:hypothetical protein
MYCLFHTCIFYYYDIYTSITCGKEVKVLERCEGERRRRDVCIEGKKEWCEAMCEGKWKGCGQRKQGQCAMCLFRIE